MYYRKVKRIARSKIADETTFAALHDLQLGLNIATTPPFLDHLRASRPIHCGALGSLSYDYISHRLRLRLMSQVIEVQDRVEHQRITSHRLSAIDRIVGKQQNIAFAQMRVHDDGMLGN
jgi:hypothetical protein